MVDIQLRISQRQLVHSPVTRQLADQILVADRLFHDHLAVLLYMPAARHHHPGHHRRRSHSLSLSKSMKSKSMLLTPTGFFLNSSNGEKISTAFSSLYS